MENDITLFPEKAKIGIAIFAYNEEDTILSVAILSKAYTDNIIIIDDGSIDRTRYLSNAAGIRLNQKRMNRGKGYGIKEAFNWARSKGLDVLITIDGDGQHDPGIIPFLAEPVIKNKADISIGSKGFTYEGKSKKSMSWKIGNWMIKRVGRSKMSSSIFDKRSGFRAYSNRTFGELKLDIDGFDQENSILEQADKKKLRILEVPMKAIYGRLEKKDIGGSNWMIATISNVLTKLHIKTPLRLSILLSSFGIMLASVAAVYSKLNYPDYEYLPPGGIFVTMVLVGLSGFILLNGIIFEAIAHVGKNMTSYLQKNDQIKLQYDPLKGFQR